MGKKVVSMVLVMAMSVLLLAGCGKKADVSTDSPSAETKKPIGVALILNGNIGDKSFNDLGYAGALRAEKELNIKLNLVENGYDTTKYEPSIIEFSEDPDYQVIVVNSADIKEIIEKVAPQYPDKTYIVYDTDIDYSKGNLSNVYSMTFKQNEASFLAGALAAKMSVSKTEKVNDDLVIGYIAGGENVIINDFLIGYIEGCEYVNENVKMLISYIGNFSDTAKGKDMALAMNMQGADVIFQVAGGAGIGVEEAAKENGTWAIGVDNDHYKAFIDTDKEMAESIITSVLKNVDECVYSAIKRYVDGTLPLGATEELGIQQGMVGIAKNDYYKQVVPQEIQDYIDKVQAGISDGSIKVDTNIGASTEFITEAKDRIKP